MRIIEKVVVSLHLRFILKDKNSMSRSLRMLMVFQLLCIVSFAQTAKKTAILKGKLINSVTKNPFNDVRVTLPALNTFVSSEGEGNFSISEVPYGRLNVIVGGGVAKRDTMSVNIDKDLVDLGDLMVTPNEGSLSEGNSDIPTIAIEENTTQDDENASSAAQSSSGFYVANQDPFLRVAALTFGTYRFRPRGYDNADVQINGAPIQDLETGYSSFAQIGGLNDVLRDRVITYGLKPSDYTFGTVKGSTYINATAADQRKGTTVSFFNSNRSFRDRIMLTYNSGITKDGWAYSGSISRRWANEGYVAGTFYDATSFYAAVSKLTKKGQFNLTAFGAPTRRGKASMEQDEAYSLAGSHFYNSDWGWQGGKKRNARVSDVFQPVIIANYTYKPSEKTRWNTAVSYEFGKAKNSNIDFYNGYSPAPDYYRNLPSYYLTSAIPNIPYADAIKKQYVNNPGLLQIDWDGLYDANRTNISTVNNGTTGQMLTGKQSIYVMSNAVDDMKKTSFNTNIEHALNEHVSLFGGAQFVYQQDEYYKELTDLMGGDFFVNLNQFAVQQGVSNTSYNQNNLKNPNQVIKVGDKYGYDYILKAMKSTVWGQSTFNYNKFYFFAGAELGMSSFSRDGLTQNGLFPDNSYGQSATHSFATYKVKGGVNYNINLRNMIYLNAGYFTDAPGSENTYISDKSRDIIINNPVVAKTSTAEIGYILRTQKMTLRATAYVTDVKDNTLIKRFFNDDPSFLTFVNYVMQGVNTRSTGTELAATYKINKQFDVTGVAAIGQYFYTDRPSVTVFQDNNPSKTAVARDVYIKNYYVGAGPQSVYSLDFGYHPRNSWRANVNFNYMDRNYVEVNPDRRTQQAADLVVAGSEQWHKIYDQEKLPSAFTIDVSAGRTFELNQYYKKMKRRTLLVFNAGITNLLNNTDIKMTGYEQLRYDFANKNPDKFPNKYGYAYGINYFVNLSLRF